MAVTINGTTGILAPDIGIDGTTLTVDAVNNRVGIGTTSPATNFKLDVNGDLSLGESGGTDNTFIDQKQNGSLEIINSGRLSNNGKIRINKTNDISGDTTYFRDFEVYDGKTNLLLLADGSSGNIGIGTDNPAEKLHVQGDIRLVDNSPRIGFHDANAANNLSCTGGIELFDSAGNRGAYMGATEGAGFLSFGISPSAGASPTEKLRISSTGQIGMGKAGAVTVNGNSPLTIQESDSNSETICLRATNSGGNGSQPGIVMKTAAGGHIGGIYCDVNSDYMRLSTSGTDRMYISDTGNVGIGDGSPSDALTVYKTNVGNPTGITIRNTEASSTYSHARLRLESQNGAAYAHLWADVANTALRLGYNSSSTINIYDNGRLTSPNQIIAGTTFSVANVSGSIAGSGGGQDYIGLRHGTTFGLMLKTAGTNVGYVGINDTNPGKRLSISNGSADEDIIRMYNDEVGINFGAWGTGSSYARETTINGTRFDSGTSPFLRIAGQGGIKFCADLNNERMRIRSDGKVEIYSNGSYGNDPKALSIGSRTSASYQGTLALARGEALGGGTGPYMELVHGPDGGTQRTHQIYSFTGDLRIFADASENLELSGSSVRFKDGSRVERFQQAAGVFHGIANGDYFLSKAQYVNSFSLSGYTVSAGTIFTVIPAATLHGGLYIIGVTYTQNGGPYHHKAAATAYLSSKNSGSSNSNWTTGGIQHSHVGGSYQMEFQETPGSTHVIAGIRVRFNYGLSTSGTLYTYAYRIGH
jgi:hypothetical protein